MGGSRCWIAYAVDNSVPRPAPDPEREFWPMRLNASPYVVSTSSGDDALCVFSTEVWAIAYLREEPQHSLTASATAVPIASEQELRQFLEYYPAIA